MESAAHWILGGFITRPFRSILPFPHRLPNDQLFAAGGRPSLGS